MTDKHGVVSEAEQWTKTSTVMTTTSGLDHLELVRYCGITANANQEAQHQPLNVGYAAARFQIPLVQPAKSASLVTPHDGAGGFSSPVPNKLDSTTMVPTPSQKPPQQTSSGGTITASIADSVLSALNIGSGSSSINSVRYNQPARMFQSVASNDGIDEQKICAIKNSLDLVLDSNTRQQIAQLVEQISALKPIAQMLLYLRLPTQSVADSDPLRQPQNPLGTRAEIKETINWVRTHLEHDPQVSIPKQDVYNEYLAHCEHRRIKPLSTADFGKVMKQVFPCVRPRRLGTRGNSRYCYAAMRKTSNLTAPELPYLAKGYPAELPSTSNAILNTKPAVYGDEVESWETIRRWSENLLHVKVHTMSELAQLIIERNQRTLSAKKYPVSREIKDTEPLKKRRRKKRKGSSSSESNSGNTNAPDDDTKPNTMPEDDLVAVKQEITDSPIQESSTRQAQVTPLLVSKNLQYFTQLSSKNNTLQIMPMNLVTEARNTQKSAATASTCAARDLTAKILSIGSAEPVEIVTKSSLGEKSSAQPSYISVGIKQENQDYDISNTFCKKVLKAQQTKGFWTNANPSSSQPAASIPTQTPSIIATNDQNSSNHYANVPMGPPSQTQAQVEQVQQQSVLTAETLEPPKVLSRNTQQLRARGLLESISGDGLVLPRERLISILQMDKHEMDSYLPQGERENTEGADSELCEIFPTDEHEEKSIKALETSPISPYLENMTGNPATNIANQQMPPIEAPSMPTGTTVSIGSASASLVLMSQKHQQQNNNAGGTEASCSSVSRKPRGMTAKVTRKGQTQPTLKQIEHHKAFNFSPISKNSAMEGTSTTTGGVVPSNGGTAAGCFASPGGVSSMRMRMTNLPKQQQKPLESDSGSDPMLGAERTKRGGYAPCSMSQQVSSSTSAPPSPKTFQNYNGLNFWSSAIDQNSMDFDSSLALANEVGEVGMALPPLAVETQRSQSVPLSQLQRGACQSPNYPTAPQHSFILNPNIECALEMSTSGVSGYFNGGKAENQIARPKTDTSVDGSLFDDAAVFSSKFEQHDRSSGTAMTCSSSAGSSSGYCSSSVYEQQQCANIISRSVPTTPLPQHQANVFSTGSFYNRPCSSELQPSPRMPGLCGNERSLPLRRRRRHNAETCSSGRPTHDLSKSMPTTPITTPCFRYSPSEADRHRDFLINGNTVDSFGSSSYSAGAGGAGGADSTTRLLCGDSLSTDTLMENGQTGHNDVDIDNESSIIAEQELLGGNL